MVTSVSAANRRPDATVVRVRGNSSAKSWLSRSPPPQATLQSQPRERRDPGDLVPLIIGLKRRARAIAAPVVFLSITAYFVWGVTQGNRGLVAHSQRLALLQQVQDDNGAAHAEKEQWDRRVAGLRANQLNPDTLDERARAMLNLADPADVVVQFNGKDKLF
jgi:cell division protein FtsB